jgi:carbonic anhydrase
VYIVVMVSILGQLNNYWTYDGSLTTPPYYESVKWIVFADVIEMSEDQVEYLKNG